MPRLRLLTYNVHAWRGSDGSRDPDRALEVIENLDAEVVALQEFETLTASELDHVSGRLQGMGYDIVFFPTLLEGSRSYGNLLLLKLPYRKAQEIDLSVEGAERRNLIAAEVRLPGRRWVQVIATHFGLRRGERRRQFRRLRAKLSLSNLGLTFVLGDLNEWNPLTGWLRELGSTSICMTEVPSFPAFLPVLALDRIACVTLMPELAQQVRQERILPAPFEPHRISDHRPVAVDVLVS